MTTLYRLLTGEDDSAFCHKVSAALANGWRLHGSPSISCDGVQGKRWCAQAVTKEVEGDYTEGMKLGDA